MLPINRKTPEAGMHILRCSRIIGILAGLPLLAQEDDLAIIERFKTFMNQQVESTTRTVHALSEAPGIVTVITAEEIEESGARTLADVLKRIPGVQIGDNRANVLMAWFRGVTTTYNEKVLLVIDGVPKRDATLSEWAPDERFDLTNVARIEVIRGPGSAIYGGDAFAAVVSIFTKKDLTTSMVQTGGGNQGTAQAGFRTGLRGKGVEATVTARTLKTDGYLSERGVNGSPTDNTNARAARNFQGTVTLKEATKFNLIYGDFDYLYPMHITLSRRDATYTYTMGSLSHDHQAFGADLHHQLNFDNTKINFFEVVRYTTPTVISPTFTAPVGAVRQIKDQKKQGMTFGLDSQALWKAGEGNHFLLGVNLERKKATYSEEEFNPYTTNPDKVFYFNSWFSKNGELAGRNVAKGTNYAVYAQDEMGLPIWGSRMTLGLRWDHYEGFGGQFSPRIGFVAQPREGTTLKALWGKAFRPPTFRQLYVVRYDGFQPGDPNLKPEEAVTAEVQITQTLGRNTRCSLAYFQSKLTDTTVTIANSQWYNSPIPRKISGLELEVRSEFQPNVSGLKSLSLFANAGHLLDNHDETPLGKVDIASVAPNTANAGVTLRTSRLSIYTALNYVGRRNAGLSYNPSKGIIENTYHATVTNLEYKAKDNKGAYLIQDLNLVLQDFSALPVRLEGSIYNLWNRRHLNPAHDPDTHYDILKENRAFQLKVIVVF